MFGVSLDKVRTVHFFPSPAPPRDFILIGPKTPNPLSPRAARSLCGKVVIVVVLVVLVVVLLLVTHAKNSLPSKTKVAHFAYCYKGSSTVKASIFLVQSKFAKIMLVSLKRTV